MENSVLCFLSILGLITLTALLAVFIALGLSVLKEEEEDHDDDDGVIREECNCPDPHYCNNCPHER